MLDPMINIKWQPTDGGKMDAGMNERRDCTVRALAIVADLPYQEAHSMLKNSGRRDGHKFGMVNWMSARATGTALYCVGKFKISRVWGLGSNVGPFLAKELPGRYMVIVRGHCFAVINGTALDTYAPRPRKKIVCVFKFEEISA